mgnify:CR=1 FL=1
MTSSLILQSPSALLEEKKKIFFFFVRHVFCEIEIQHGGKDETK